MLTLALHAGLRVSELIAINRADIELGTGAHVRVEGKGRKQRAVPLTKDAQAVLAAWLDERAWRPDDPLFPTRTGRRLTRDAVERRVATHVATAAQRCRSLAGKRVHPHVLRHSCAMSLLPTKNAPSRSSRHPPSRRAATRPPTTSSPTSTPSADYANPQAARQPEKPAVNGVAAASQDLLGIAEPSA